MKPHQKIVKNRYDQNLVADQSGRMIFFSGFFVALLLGLLFRGLTAPQRIQAFVTEAAQRIHKNIDVHFESAEVSLSHRGLPRLAVVVHNVEMTSNLSCWMQPRLAAKEIILPFSLMGMMFEHQPFKKIMATEVDIKLRSKYAPCLASPEIAEKNIPKPEAITLLRRRKDMDLSVNPTLDRLEIDQLRIQYDPSSENAIEMIDLSLQVKSHQPKTVLLKATTELINSTGQVWLEYKEFPEHQISAHFSGNWREGNYALNADYNLSDTALKASAELSHIPAVPVIEALKKYGWLREDLDGRKLWVTMKSHSEGFAKDWQNIPLFLNDVRVEGDLGEIEVEEFQAKSLKPFLFKPVQVRLKNLKADRFLEFLKQPRRPNFLGELGEFNGRLVLKSDQEMSLSGRHSGLEFIFSNRGKRQIQKLTSFDAELKLQKNKWELSTKDIVLEQGQFDGEVKATADRDLKKIDLQIKSENFQLAGPVQQLMTGRDQKATFKSQLQMQWQDGRLNSLGGYVRSAELSIDELSFEKLNSQFSLKNEVLQMQVAAQSIKVQAPSKAFDLISQLTKTSETSVLFKQFSGQFEIPSDQRFNWKGLSAQLGEKALKISSEGQWDSQGFLSGKDFLGNKDRQQKWNLLGHRDEPKLEVQP